MISKKIQALINVHGDRYDYSLAEEGLNYKNRYMIKIICKEHGIFTQNYYNHLKLKHGCPKCACVYNYDTEDYIKKAKEVHGDRYDYSLVQYKNNRTKIKIICKEHGIFEQNPKHHLRGSGCKKCAETYNYDTKEFIKRAKEIHGDKYDYSLTEYKNNRTKVKIICKEHGIFEQNPSDHLSSHGCLKCSFKETSNRQLSDTGNFIKKAKEIHGDKYDYSLVEYKHSKEKVKLICKEHGMFEMKPNSHLNGQGCPVCINAGRSNQQTDLIDYIQLYNQNTIVKTFDIITPYELDIYLPDLKVAFEFNGLYWHSTNNKSKNYHLMKTELCEKKGIHLVHIYEDDWINKQEIVKSRILNLLGKTPNRIYARECEIHQVDFNISKDFLLNNHLQGNCTSKYRYGLFYKNELVSLMTFGNLRKNLGQKSEEGTFELLRFCNKLNTSVVGGANKLFKYFVNQIKPKKIISYADRSWTMNNGKSLYDKLGFKLINITKQNYNYINNNIRVNRFKFRKDVLIKEGYDSNKTEHEIMLEREIYRIYNSGNLKFEKEIIHE